MADKKITDLTLRDDVDDDVNFPVDDGIQTYRVTSLQVKAHVLLGGTANQLLGNNAANSAKEYKSITAGRAISVTHSAGGIAIAASDLFKAPTGQKFLSGSGTYNLQYAFEITSGNATVGATYTNNGITYTVWATVASATLVYMSGSGAPTSTGTLTKASGTGDSTLTFSLVKTPLYLRVRLIGGGGGGAGSGTAAGTAAGDGGASTFGTTLLSAGGGVKGVYDSNGGVGGSSSLGTGPFGIAITGGSGGAASRNATTAVRQAGGKGGGAGGSGGSPGATGTGNAASANTGGGGGGAESTNSGSGCSGSGGGGGGYVDATIISPLATYAYAVGAAGTAGGAGTGGLAGGAGGSGYVEVTEFYQ